MDNINEGNIFPDAEPNIAEITWPESELSFWRAFEKSGSFELVIHYIINYLVNSYLYYTFSLIFIITFLLMNALSNMEAALMSTKDSFGSLRFLKNDR